MPKYTLTYFNAKARAETSRYMFAIAGVEYEDKRVESEAWAKLKPTLPLGQLPVLEVDGKQLPQSLAIHRFVGSELGFYGPSAWERAQADVILDTLLELTPHILAVFAEKDEAKKIELKMKLETEHFPKNLANLETLLKLNNGSDGWFVGDKVSLADIDSISQYCDFLPALVGKKELDLSKYEKFAALVKRFNAIPEVAEWRKNRPQTNM